MYINFRKANLSNITLNIEATNKETLYVFILYIYLYIHILYVFIENSPHGRLRKSDVDRS